MDAGRIHCVNRMHAGNNLRDHRLRQLVNQLAEDRVFLGWATDDRKRPDGIVAAIYLLDAEHGKVVRKTVVSKVIAERPFRK